MENLFIMSVATLAWISLCIVMWLLHRARQQKAVIPETEVLIVYASQTGNAQTLAGKCAQALDLSEMANVIPLNNLTLEHLMQVKKVLFILSTYGDGEAPDNGNLFDQLLSQALKNAIKLNTLNYSVIALGDSSYPQFCAFGHHVNKSLKLLNAQPLSNMLLIDKYDPQTTLIKDIIPSGFEIKKALQEEPICHSNYYWKLVDREILNPNCSDQLLVLVTLESLGPMPCWQAGDLIDIQPRQKQALVEDWLVKHVYDGSQWLSYKGHQQPLSQWLMERELPLECQTSINDVLEQLPVLQKRSYSVASITEDKKLKLIVRLLKKNNGSIGVASGYLGHHCQIGSVVQGNIRPVKAHHNIGKTQPIILIGSGSGLAGLKAQISARTYNKQTLNKETGPIWLIYGERRSNPKLPINKHLSYLKATQVAKMHCAFSKDDSHPKYVQDILLEHQKTLKEWIMTDAIIYVCGSLSGMGDSVHRTLIDILGQENIEELQLQQRYIRDVY